ncbi:ANTAR domain-containing protein [Streptomyces sp. NPDC017940]|uniref:ANTAR domain-containing protein n=1 Tax=Streptomyces sp. NPDC017940 TaxID=3365017 RepID=UPI0037A6AF8D
MGQQRCTAERAFQILSRASQNRNIKLRDVAAGIITQVTGQPPTPARPAPAHPTSSVGPRTEGWRPPVPAGGGGGGSPPATARSAPSPHPAPPANGTPTPPDRRPSGSPRTSRDLWPCGARPRRQPTTVAEPSPRRAKESGACEMGLPAGEGQNSQNGCEEMPTTAGSKSSSIAWSRSSQDS